MKALWFFLLALMAFAQISAAQERTETVSVTNVAKSTLNMASTEKQPVEFSGSFHLQESLSGNQLERKQDGTMVMKNITNKNIIALIATFKIRAFHDPVQPIMYRHDYFFKPHGLAPEGTTEIPLDQTTGENVKRLPPAQPSYVQAELLYVQFDDGTSWGDSATAAELRAQRLEVEAYLKNLVHSYETEGDAGFRKAIAVRPTGQTELSSVVQQLSRLNEESGIKDTMARVKTRLQTCAERKATGRF